LLTRQRKVPPEAQGQRLDAFLAAVEKEFSRSRLKALIEKGAITLNGQSCKPSKMLSGGEILDFYLEPPSPAVLTPENIPLDIMFEDHDIIVVAKPAGMVVHPGAGNSSGTLVHALLAHCKDLEGIGGELRPGIVHRLDKETTGCVAIAKNELALTKLQAQFKNRTVEKTYLALVHGVPPLKGRWETLHARHPTNRQRFTSRVNKGRKAITDWKVDRQFETTALVRIALLTGRTHQIRVHFSEAGFPLLHDSLYGGVRREQRLPSISTARRAAEILGRQALHALRLVLRHPSSGHLLALEAPLPADFRNALAVLESCSKEQNRENSLI
jgi:23S rRNA pseudouridine1911/1915/1917 synthase